jgi:hypothetical protein
MLAPAKTCAAMRELWRAERLRRLVAPTRPSSSRRVPGPRVGRSPDPSTSYGQTPSVSSCATCAPEPRARRRQSSRMGSSPTPCDGRSSPSTGIGTVGRSNPANYPTPLQRPRFKTCERPAASRSSQVRRKEVRAKPKPAQARSGSHECVIEALAPSFAARCGSSTAPVANRWPV